jgi:hypothetical protein
VAAAGLVSVGIQDLHYFLQNLHNRRLVHIQPRGKLFLKSGQLPRKLGSAAKRLTHFRKGTNNKNAHLNRACAVQNVGSHQRPVFGEGVWQIFYVLGPASRSQIVTLKPETLSPLFA